jgi:light-regulated signal transduction histidine kinase (bacteriophytochrome)
VEGVAAQAAIAIDNARLYEAAQAQLATREARRSFALRDSDRRKDEFLATLAHELRNPLAPIRQAVNISQNPAATRGTEAWSHEVITRQVQHMSLLLRRPARHLAHHARHARAAPQAHATRERDRIGDRDRASRPSTRSGHARSACTCRTAVTARRRIRCGLSQVLSNLLTNRRQVHRSRRPAAHRRRTGGRRGGRSGSSNNGIGIATGSHAATCSRCSRRCARCTIVPDGGLGIGLALSTRTGGTPRGRLEGTQRRDLGTGSEFVVRLPARRSRRPIPPRRRRGGFPIRRRRVLVAD